MFTIRKIATILAIVALAGCAEARLMSQDEAYAYCHQHTAGSTLAMNPFGEEYATWMSYCQPTWQAQNQQMFNLGVGYGEFLQQRAQFPQAGQRNTLAQPGMTCYTQGVFTRCQ